MFSGGYKKGPLGRIRLTVFDKYWFLIIPNRHLPAQS